LKYLELENGQIQVFDEKSKKLIQKYIMLDLDLTFCADPNKPKGSKICHPSNLYENSSLENK